MKILLLLLSKFNCCGANGPNDWASSKYNNEESSKILSMAVSSSNRHYRIPESCCLADVAKEKCDISRVLPIASPIDMSVIHFQVNFKMHIIINSRSYKIYYFFFV